RYRRHLLGSGNTQNGRNHASFPIHYPKLPSSTSSDSLTPAQRESEVAADHPAKGRAADQRTAELSAPPRRSLQQHALALLPRFATSHAVSNRARSRLPARRPSAAVAWPAPRPRRKNRD